MLKSHRSPSYCCSWQLQSVRSNQVLTWDYNDFYWKCVCKTLKFRIHINPTKTLYVIVMIITICLIKSISCLKSHHDIKYIVFWKKDFTIVKKIILVAACLFYYLQDWKQENDFSGIKWGSAFASSPPVVWCFMNFLRHWVICWKYENQINFSFTV